MNVPRCGAEKWDSSEGASEVDGRGQRGPEEINEDGS